MYVCTVRCLSRIFFAMTAGFFLAWFRSHIYSMGIFRDTGVQEILLSFESVRSLVLN